MNNLQSIFDGITRGFRSDRQVQITKESTQNPLLEPDNKSPGTAIRYAQPIPTAVTVANPYEMNPVNAHHWGTYFADHTQRFPVFPIKPNPANILAALSEPQDASTVGSGDVWVNHYDFMSINQKTGWSPSSYRGQ